MLSGKPVNWQEPITQSDLKDILNSHQNGSNQDMEVARSSLWTLAKCQVEVGRGCWLRFSFMNRNYRPRGLIKAKLVYRENKRSLFLEYIFRRSIWDLPELVLRRTQNLTIIDLEKHKIEQIYIRNSMTTRFAISTLIYIISMEFLSLRRRRPSCRNDLSGGERGEAAVFAPCLFYRRKFGISISFWESAHLHLP